MKAPADNSLIERLNELHSYGDSGFFSESNSSDNTQQSAFYKKQMSSFGRHKNHFSSPAANKTAFHHLSSLHSPRQKNTAYDAASNASNLAMPKIFGSEKRPPEKRSSRSWFCLSSGIFSGFAAGWVLIVSVATAFDDTLPDTTIELASLDVKKAYSSNRLPLYAEEGLSRVRLGDAHVKPRILEANQANNNLEPRLELANLKLGPVKLVTQGIQSPDTEGSAAIETDARFPVRHYTPHTRNTNGAEKNTNSVQDDVLKAERSPAKTPQLDPAIDIVKTKKILATAAPSTGSVPPKAQSGHRAAENNGKHAPVTAKPAPSSRIKTSGQINIVLPERKTAQLSKSLSNAATKITVASVVKSKDNRALPPLPAQKPYAAGRGSRIFVKTAEVISREKQRKALAASEKRRKIALARKKRARNWSQTAKAHRSALGAKRRAAKRARVIRKARSLPKKKVFTGHPGWANNALRTNK